MVPRECLPPESIFGATSTDATRRAEGKSASSLSVFPEKEGPPTAGEDERGSIAEQRGKSPMENAWKRGYVALPLVTKGERGQKSRQRQKRRQPVERSKGVEQNPIKSVQVQLPSGRYMKNIFWVKLVRPFKLSPRIPPGYRR